jgi:hypothetical protein
MSVDAARMSPRGRQHQNTTLRANWIDLDPPIWYNGFKPAFTPPCPRLWLSICVE